MRGLGWLAHDLKYSIRSLLKDRGSVGLALLALALGIGATTVIFSVVYSVLINAFPFRESSRVVHFYINAADRPGRSAWYSAREFADYREQNQVFSQLLGGASLEVLYNLDNATYRVRGALLDPRALPALGLTPILGRELTDADGAPEAPATFVMSDRMWNERFHRDPGVLGRSLKMNGTMRTLIAVAPPRFLLHGADVFFPTTISASSTEALLGGPPTEPLDVWTYGRLKPGVTLQQAAANLDVIAHNEAKLYPERYPAQFSVSVMSLADAYTASSLKEMVYILLGAVVMLLLIACSNVANLLLARATARDIEFALRSGLGASRARLMQLLLAESALLAGAGAVLGGLLAYLGLQWVKAAIPVDALPAEMEIRFSAQALMATIGVTLSTALLCGLVPAFSASRGNLHGRLMSTGKGVGLRSGHGRLRTLLVSIQVGLAIVLLVGAGLMMRTLFALQHIEPGVNPKNVLVGRMAFPENQRQTPAERVLFLKRVLLNVRTIPGVVAASPAFGMPLERGPSSPLTIPGATLTGRVTAAIEFVGDEYFAALGLPLLAGRALSPADVDGARQVVVVNHRFVHDFLGDTNPLGRTVTFAAVDRSSQPAHVSLFEIVGVVGDSRNSGLQEDIRPQAFLPYTIPGVQPSALVLRTGVDPLTLQNGVRQQIWNVDQHVALTSVMSLEQVLDRDALAAPKFGVGLLSVFAAVGLILSAIGVFSVMAYTVSLQTHEIGIRMALGAEPRGVTRLMVLRGLRPILAGVVIGLGASYGLSRLLANQLFGVTPTDPWTFGAVAIILIAVGLVACLLPARRAMRVDPLVAVRHG